LVPKGGFEPPTRGFSDRVSRYQPVSDSIMNDRSGKAPTGISPAASLFVWIRLQETQFVKVTPHQLAERHRPRTARSIRGAEHI
jgi:hypothetical protein